MLSSGIRACAVGGAEGDIEECAGHQLEVVLGGEAVLVVDPVAEDGGRAAALELLHLHLAPPLSVSGPTGFYT